MLGLELPSAACSKPPRWLASLNGSTLTPIKTHLTSSSRSDPAGPPPALLCPPSRRPQLVLLRAPAAYQGRLSDLWTASTELRATGVSSPDPSRRCAPTTSIKFAQFSLADPIICSAGLSADSLPTHWQATFSFKAKKSLFLPCLTATHLANGASRDIRDEQEIIKDYLEALGYDAAILEEEPLQLSTIKELFRAKDSVFSNLEDQAPRRHPEICRNNVRLAASFVPESSMVTSYFSLRSRTSTAPQPTLGDLMSAARSEFTKSPPPMRE